MIGFPRKPISHHWHKVIAQSKLPAYLSSCVSTQAGLAGEQNIITGWPTSSSRSGWLSRDGLKSELTCRRGANEIHLWNDRAQYPEASVLVDNSISFHRVPNSNRSIRRVSNSRYIRRNVVALWCRYTCVAIRVRFVSGTRFGIK